MKIEKILDLSQDLFNYSENETQQVLDKLKSDGYKLLRFIDSGSYGVVIYIGNDRVLKITADEQEANAMNIVMKHPHLNIVKIFRVWRYSSFKGIWFIEQEKLQNSNFHYLLSNWFDYLIVNTEKDKEVVKNLEYDFGGECTIDHLFGYITDSMLEKEKIDWIINHSELKIKNAISQMVKAATHLSDLKISFYDWEGSGNVMQKNGIYKITDLGQSQVPNSNIEIRENIKLKESF